MFNIGQRVGILNLLEKKIDNGRVYFKCFCDCGKIVWKSSTTLYHQKGKAHHIFSCGCRHGKKKAENKKWTGHDVIHGVTLRGIEYGARVRNIKYDLAPQDLISIYKSQNGRCYFSGVEIVFGGRNKTTASLDRLDSNGHYNVNNCVWVHKTINLMKRKMSKDDFVKLCKSVEAPVLGGCGEITVKQHPKSFRGFGNIYSDLYIQFKNAATRRDKEFPISIHQVWDLYVSQNGCCALTGIPLTLTAFSRGRPTASLTRIDGNKPYALDNMAFVHKDITKNFKMVCKTFSEIKQWCGLISENSK